MNSSRINNKHKILIMAALIVASIWLTAFIFFALGESKNNSIFLSPAESDYQINQDLTDLLYVIPGAISAKVSLISSTISENMVGYNQTPAFTFSLVYGQTLPGYVIGPLYKNIPLSQMEDYLPALLANKCSFNDAAEVKNIFLKIRLDNRKITSFLVCPLYDNRMTLLGAVYVSWTKNSNGPNVALLDTYKNDLMNTAQKIDNALIWRNGPAVN